MHRGLYFFGSAFLLLTSAFTLGCSDGSSSGPDTCGGAMAEGLALCVESLSVAARDCYIETGAACDEAAPAVEAALGSVESTIAQRCASLEDRTRAGYAEAADLASLIARGRSLCEQSVEAISARSFGGPQGAALVDASEANIECVSDLHEVAALHLASAVRELSSCIEGGACTEATARDALTAEMTALSDELTAACSNSRWRVGAYTSQLAAATTADAECLVAAAWPAHDPVELECGPRPEVIVPTRGEATQVVFEDHAYGTQCGQGDDYAFWVRLAPEENPVERVVVQLQGGGGCVFEEDCAQDLVDSPELFIAEDDTMPEGGILSTDATKNPFAEFTQVFLPYCTRDLFIGSRTDDLGSIQVERFGAINMRAALRYVRDLIWTVRDQEEGVGYRPDQMEVVFGGTSAGGYGVLYNFHYVVDDLGWQHTSAVPDAALALDADKARSVGSIGLLLLANNTWGSVGYFPPYCSTGDCVVGPVLLAAHGARLVDGDFPQFLPVSNQVDQTQTSTTFFDDAASWLNEARASYCETRDLPGVSYFFSAVDQSIHGFLENDERYGSLLVADGVTVRDWLEDAILLDPPGAADAVEEGTLTTGDVVPFPCSVD